MFKQFQCNPEKWLGQYDESPNSCIPDIKAYIAIAKHHDDLNCYLNRDYSERCCLCDIKEEVLAIEKNWR